MKKLILFLLILSFAAQAQQKIQWPHHAKSVIVLTYDDALQSQLDVAVPQLEKAHLPATFFLTADINYTTIPRWRKLADKGFELGNHTNLHPCMAGEDTRVNSAGYTAYGMIREIENMNHFLFAVDGKTTRTFAYPCAETMAGGKDYVDTLRRFNFIKYARVGGDFDDAVITNFRRLDPLRVPSLGLEGGNTSAQLIAFVKKVQQSGGMGIIMMHGVGGDYIAVSAKVHQELLNYLKKNKHDIWVATFQDAMDYAMKAKQPQSQLTNAQAFNKDPRN